MYSIHCVCGKIVCQVDNMPTEPAVEYQGAPVAGPSVVILCRHCKRYVVLQVPTVAAVKVTSDVHQPLQEPFFVP